MYERKTGKSLDEMIINSMAASVVRTDKEEGSTETSVLSVDYVEPSFSPAVSVHPEESASPADTSRVEAVDGGEVSVEERQEEGEGKRADEALAERRSSVSSNDSFYSAEGEDEVLDLYSAARKLVQNNSVQCRKNR